MSFMIKNQAKTNQSGSKHIVCHFQQPSISQFGPIPLQQGFYFLPIYNYDRLQECCKINGFTIGHYSSANNNKAINNKMLRLAKHFSTEIGQQQQNMRRFYKQATVTLNPHKKHPLHSHLLLLDGKTVKTPYHHPLAFPTQALAFLVVNQFNRQQKVLKTGEMPILALTRTAVDADIEGHLAQHLRTTIYQYLKTDTLLFIDDRFAAQHKKLASPLLQFFTSKFGIDLKPSNSIQPPEVQINDRFVRYVQSLSNWQLIGLQTMTIWMKSTVGAFAVAESSFNPVDIQKASYLEQDLQMRNNGEVEEKLMDVNQIRLMVSCGEMMYKLSSPQMESSL